MMKIEKQLGALKVNLKFDDKLCVLTGNSGTGKTYVLNILESCAMNQGITHRAIDNRSENDSPDMIAQLCKGKDLVLLDNADLYLTEELLKRICSNAKQVIVSIHYAYCTLAIKDRGIYGIKFTGDTLTSIKER